MAEACFLRKLKLRKRIALSSMQLEDISAESVAASNLFVLDTRMQMRAGGTKKPSHSDTTRLQPAPSLDVSESVQDRCGLWTLDDADAIQTQNIRKTFDLIYQNLLCVYCFFRSRSLPLGLYTWVLGDNRRVTYLPPYGNVPTCLPRTAMSQGGGSINDLVQHPRYAPFRRIAPWEDCAGFETRRLCNRPLMDGVTCTPRVTSLVPFLNITSSENGDSFLASI